MEASLLIFLYLSAYLTGIGALLERLDEEMDNGWWWILLVFYSLVPIGYCVGSAKLLTMDSNGLLLDVHGKDIGCPKDPTEEEYAEWLDEFGRARPYISIISPFKKKYAWCVVDLWG